MDDFEKLQIAKLHNKKLLEEIGILQSEKAELDYYLSLDVKKLQLKQLRQEIKRLRKTNSQLIEKLSNNKDCIQ